MAESDANRVVSESENAKTPLGVTCDEEGENIVRLCIVIPGIKKKKFGKNDMANGSVNVKYGLRSLELTVHVISKNHGDTKFDLYKYNVKRLPDEILDAKCHHKVKKDQIVLYLFKAKARSWAAELDRTGPETDRGEDDVE